MSEIEQARALLVQLEGRWDAEGTSVTERWHVEDDGQIWGEVIDQSRAENRTSEKLRIEISGERLTLVGRGMGQGEELRFEMTEVGAQHIQFENPAHRFPQKIIYQFTSEDRTDVIISGSRNGEEKVFRVKYLRLPD